MLVEKPMATCFWEAAELLELEEAGPGVLVCAPHTFSVRPSGPFTAAVRAGEVGDLLTARARYGWAGPWWNSGSTPPAVSPVRPRRLQRHEPVRPLRPRAAGDGDGRRRDPGPRGERPPDPGGGRRQCARAPRLRDARFAVVTTGFTMQRYRSPAIEVYGSEAPSSSSATTGRRRVGAVRNEDGAWRIFPESDPHWQWTEGLRHLVECVEAGRPTVTRPEHAYRALEVMLAAQAAGHDGVARSIESGFPTRSTTPSGSTSTRSDGRTTAGATMGYRPSPRPSFDAPRRSGRGCRAARLPGVTRTRDSSRTGSTSSTDPRHRLRPRERRVPTLGELPHGVRRRRAAPRAPGRSRPREPGDRRGRAGGAGESVFFRRDTWHHGFAYEDEPLQVLEFFAPPPAKETSGAYARTRPYLQQSRYAVDGVVGEPRRRVRTRNALCSPPGRRRLAARSRCPRGPARQHRAPHGGTLTVAAGRTEVWRRATTAKGSST